MVNDYINGTVHSRKTGWIDHMELVVGILTSINLLRYLAAVLYRSVCGSNDGGLLRESRRK